MIFSSLLGLVGFFQTRINDKVVIDDFPFRLHYVYTTSYFFLSSALVSLPELVGKSQIDCLHANKAQNRYCWIKGTHLMPSSEIVDITHDG